MANDEFTGCFFRMWKTTFHRKRYFYHDDPHMFLVFYPMFSKTNHHCCERDYHTMPIDAGMRFPCHAETDLLTWSINVEDKKYIYIYIMAQNPKHIISINIIFYIPKRRNSWLLVGYLNSSKFWRQAAGYLDVDKGQKLEVGILCIKKNGLLWKLDLFLLSTTCFCLQTFGNCFDMCCCSAGVVFSYGTGWYFDSLLRHLQLQLCAVYCIFMYKHDCLAYHVFIHVSVFVHPFSFGMILTNNTKQLPLAPVSTVAGPLHRPAGNGGPGLERCLCLTGWSLDCHFFKETTII